MKRAKSWISVFSACVACALVLGGCNVALVQFIVPPVMMAGGTAEIVVAGNATGQQAGTVGAAIQIPAGFTVVAAATNAGVGASPSTPYFNGMYTPEPGYTVVYYTGYTYQL